MKLEEIKKLSDEELGKMLAAVLGYKTRAFSADEAAAFSVYPHRYYFHDHRHWRLCTDLACDLNLLAKVEKTVIEKLNTNYSDPNRSDGLTYSDALIKVLDIKPRTYNIERFATATARQRAEACLLILNS